MMQSPLLLLLTFFAGPIFAQVEIHEWTNKGGRTIKAKFISGDASTVTIFLYGRNFVLKLSDLSEESQALARKLSAPCARVYAPQRLLLPPGSSLPPPPSTVKTVGSGGKSFAHAGFWQVGELPFGAGDRHS